VDVEVAEQERLVSGHYTLTSRCVPSAGRYRAMGKAAVFSVYVRNFWSEILRHRPADGTHLDVRV
jgi:hypothetical protein